MNPTGTHPIPETKSQLKSVKTLQITDRKLTTYEQNSFPHLSYSLKRRVNKFPSGPEALSLSLRHHPLRSCKIHLHSNKLP